MRALRGRVQRVFATGLAASHAGRGGKDQGQGRNGRGMAASHDMLGGEDQGQGGDGRVLHARPSCTGAHFPLTLAVAELQAAGAS